ncbi:hypothetical protein GOP47_0020799 [Adiantum capillus-veneris]|uniref:Hydroxyproline O-arabinosyltransferase-like domain-containing protein n=1 Tax=Adiantum capillus-veneris TaxID=13818 RepID=A0A9D4U9U6_ADICA|nr:hypothetical protein GOP47_0020799 [Adiantum capillus-veneris]
MGSKSLLFWALILFATFLATYNTISLLQSGHSSSTGSFDSDTDSMINSFDPIVKLRQKFSIERRHQRQGKQRLFHVAVTASNSAYNHWQCRIMYYWYKKFQHMPGSEMGGFTRILHSGTNDHLMMEIPTVVVDELPKGVDQGYVVLNRPWAFVQWLQRVPIEEDYIMMAEPDHIIVKPLPNLATEDIPAAFPFFYITPTKYEEVVRKYYPEHMGPVSNVDPIGNSPAIIKKSQLEKIAPTWMNISLQMKGDPEADKTFGWVLEMYAYAIASAVHGVKHALKKDFMIQPPWDLEVGEKLLIHYTYGCDYNMKGELTYGKIGEWRFDKRSHLLGAPPKNLPLPPRGVPESVVTLVKMVNEATANIPFWEEGK